MITCVYCKDRRSAAGPDAAGPYPIAIAADGTIDYQPTRGGLPADGRHIYRDDKHHTVEGVRRCAATTVEDPDTFPCTWSLERLVEGERYTYDCRAIAWDTGRGFACDAGHEHVNADTRRREGWEYAEDDGEAKNLAMAGIDPVGMDGGSYAWGTR